MIPCQRCGELVADETWEAHLVRHYRGELATLSPADVIARVAEAAQRQSGTRTLTLELDASLVETLNALATSTATPGAPAEVIVLYLLRSMRDGIRRPGSWERQCMLQLFGELEVKR